MSNKKSIFEDHAITAVPKDVRRSFTSMFMTYTGVIVCMAVIWTGGELGTGLDLNSFLIAIVFGSLISGIIGLLTGVVGGYTRVTTYVILRHSFGRLGSQIAGAAVSGIGCGIGWFFIQAWLFAVVIQTISLELWGTVPMIFYGPVAAAWGAALMTLTAVLGFKGIAFLSYITIPLFVVILGGGSYAAITEAGGFAAVPEVMPTDPITVPVAITAIVGSYIAGATITSDISRFSIKSTHGGWAWFWHIMLFQPILYAAAGLLTMLTPGTDVAQAMAYLGIGVGALFIVIMGQWTTNDSNLYNGALAFANTFKLSKPVITVIMGAIGAVMASLTAMGVFGADPFMAFLGMLGTWLPPIAGIMIADFYIIKPYLHGLRDPQKRYVFGPGTEYSVINWIGIISWVAAGLIAFFVPMGIGALNAVISAFVIYLVLTFIAEKANINYSSGKSIESESGF